MPIQSLIQQAIHDARAGRADSARELFLEVVELDPQNELAWMWLAGLLEDLEQRQEACRRLLAINPGNHAAQAYLEKLRQAGQQAAREKARRLEAALKEAGRLIKARRGREALPLLRQIAGEGAASGQVWRWLARFSPDLDEQVQALEQALACSPDDLRLKQELRRARHYQQHPLALAKLYEEQGLIPQALAVYTRMGAAARSAQEWDAIYHNITRLEARQQAGIRFVRPALSRLRLAAGPPLLYLALMLIQAGFDPFAGFDPLVWLGLALSALGGWLTALASVRARHPIWQAVFQDESSGGSPLARLAVGAAGWLAVLAPQFYLLADSYTRLSGFVIRFP